MVRATNALHWTYLIKITGTWRHIVFLLGQSMILVVATYALLKTGYISHLGPQFGTAYQRVN